MKIIRFGLIMVMTLMIAACQNDGHIGELFGTWRVESYTLDGYEMPLVGASSFSFQGEVVEIVYVPDNYGTNWRRVGTWRREGDLMQLNFTYHDDNNATGEGIYKAPEWLGMTSDEIMDMICTIDGKKMVWRRVTPSATYCYTLHKTW